MSKEKAAAAGLWSALDLALRQGLQFLVSIVLARLLIPEDFGIAALAAFFAGLSITFIQSGIALALVRCPDTSRQEESAVFWWNVGGSAMFALLLTTIASTVADFYGHPVLAPLIMVAGLQGLFAALGSVHAALLTRELRFDRLTKAGVAASLAGAAAGVGAALLGAGVWALMIQLAVVAAVDSLLLWFLCKWRPIFHFRIASIRRLFRFGLNLSLSSLLELLYAQGFALVLGKFHGVRELGLYSRAKSTQFLPSNLIGSIVGRVALPIFAGRADRPDELRRGLRTANSLTMLINVPTMAGLILLSDLVIVTLFGEKWLAAAPVLSILALGGLLHPLHVTNLQLLLARDQSGAFLRLEVAKKLVGITSLVAGSYFGIEGLAWSHVAFSVVALAMNAWPTKRLLDYGALRQLKDLAGIFLLTAIMSAVILALRPLLLLSPPLQLLLLVGVGGLSYLAAGSILGIADFKQALALLRSALFRSEPTLAARSPEA